MPLAPALHWTTATGAALHVVARRGPILIATDAQGAYHVARLDEPTGAGAATLTPIAGPLTADQAIDLAITTPPHHCDACQNRGTS